MAKDNGKVKSVEVKLPEGRLINSALFTKDAYNEKSVPKYKIEVAFSKKDKAFDEIIGEIEAAAQAKYGSKAKLDIDGGDVVSGIIDGDKLAAKREKKGKEGDAYKGTWVIRASTIYNKHGEDGPGGITVLDEALEEVDAAQNKVDNVVYNGCYIEALTALGFYTNDDGEDCLNWYLKAVQKVGDGEKLAGTASDVKAAFKPREGAARRERSRGEDDDRPSRRSRDDDDQEEAPRRGRREEAEEPPRRSRRDEDDDRPSRRGRDEEPPRRSRRE